MQLLLNMGLECGLGCSHKEGCNRADNLVPGHFLQFSLQWAQITQSCTGSILHEHLCHPQQETGSGETDAIDPCCSLAAGVVVL